MKIKAKAKAKSVIWAVSLTAMFIIVLNMSYATTPEGPTVSVLGNSTRNTGAGTKVNITGGVGQNTSGGYIFSINLDALQTNARWKAYYGNVTGVLTLDDANAYTIYRWPVSAGGITGNVYATRASSTPTWAGVACASVAQIETENFALNHTNANDNITATFNATNHSTFIVAGTSLNTCRYTATYKNDVAQAQNLAADFQEIVIHDGTNVVYVTNIENDVTSYSGGPADFQILVPENGLATWASSTAYYFYVELQ